VARARSQGRFFVVCPFFPACVKHLPPRVRDTSCFKQRSCWLRYISRKFWQIFLLFRQRILQHTCRIGWLRFWCRNALMTSPRARSILVYRFVLLCYAEKFETSFSNGVAPVLLLKFLFPLLLFVSSSRFPAVHKSDTELSHVTVACSHLPFVKASLVYSLPKSAAFLASYLISITHAHTTQAHSATLRLPQEITSFLRL